uniref:Uncharacterized protein n=1 Tax=Timema monikensis TaxID=170555 RepID=A0A7R9EDE6_9NEOP|nr:unnamed protein product [Timema monikensis]
MIDEGGEMKQMIIARLAKTSDGQGRYGIRLQTAITLGRCGGEGGNNQSQQYGGAPKKFRSTEVRQMSMIIALANKLKQHSTFMSKKKDSSVPADPSSEGEEEYSVEKILDRRVKNVNLAR